MMPSRFRSTGAQFKMLIVTISTKLMDVKIFPWLIIDWFILLFLLSLPHYSRLSHKSILIHLNSSNRCFKKGLKGGGDFPTIIWKEVFNFYLLTEQLDNLVGRIGAGTVTQIEISGLFGRSLVSPPLGGSFYSRKIKSQTILLGQLKVKVLHIGAKKESLIIRHKIYKHL